MKKGLIIVAAIVLAAIAASPVTAHREWRGGYGSGPGNVADIAGIPGLNLSPEQMARIGTLREAHRRDIKPLQEQLMGKADSSGSSAGENRRGRILASSAGGTTFAVGF
jgi:hypothetical protein